MCGFRKTVTVKVSELKGAAERELTHELQTVAPQVPSQVFHWGQQRVKNGAQAPGRTTAQRAGVLEGCPGSAQTCRGEDVFVGRVGQFCHCSIPEPVLTDTAASHEQWHTLAVPLPLPRPACLCGSLGPG